MELVVALGQAQVAALQAHQFSGPWSSIAVVHKIILTSEKVLLQYKELLARPKPPEWMPVATAFVCAPDVEGLFIIKPLLVDIYKSVKRPMNLFTDLETAKVWCQLEVAKASRYQRPL